MPARQWPRSQADAAQRGCLPPACHRLLGPCPVLFKYPSAYLRASMTSMQDDLFGDALLQPPASSSNHAASRANPEVSALRGMAKVLPRSEERRVGKEWGSTCRSRWSPFHYKKKNQTKQDK